MEKVFPLGLPLRKVEQQDRSPKKVFILGACANAVHAKWIDVEGNVIIEALPVASEPYPLWDGENVEQILQDVPIPPELGKLLPVEKKENWFDKHSMDHKLLQPLGCKREDAWFCYVMPFPRLNPGKLGAIKANYNSLAETYDLPECSIPIFNPAEFRNPTRVKEILMELKQSQADTIVLLGDIPIKHFLSHFSEYNSLKDFEKGLDDIGKLTHYGKKQKIEIAGKLYNVIPLIDFVNIGKSKNWMHEHCHMYWEGKSFIHHGLKLLSRKDPSIVTHKPDKCPICQERKIATIVHEHQQYSESNQAKSKNGKVILKDEHLAEDDPKYCCLKCGFEFFEKMQ